MSYNISRILFEALACWAGHFDLAKNLIEKGAELNSVNDSDSTPLHRTCFKGDLPLTRLLLESGADFHMCDRMGRTPMDITTNDDVRALLLEKLNAEAAAWALQQAEQMAKQEAVADANELARLELAQKRLSKAVTVVVTGSMTPRVNGYYTPLSQESDDWPIYSKLGDREMLLRYVKPEWIIQTAADRFKALGSDKPPRAYVRLLCDPATYPELRGNTSIFEYREFIGGLYLSHEPSKILLMTESEAQGQRASEMMKVAASTTIIKREEACGIDLVQTKPAQSPPPSL